MTHSAVDVVSNWLPVKPALAIICGSGILPAFDEFAVLAEIPYAAVPGLPIPKQSGHAKVVRCVQICGVPTLLFGGRCHLYEGYSAREVCAQIELIAALGIANVIQTNAVGGIGANLNVGDIVLADDVIDLTFVARTSDGGTYYQAGGKIVNAEWHREVQVLAADIDVVRTGTYVQVTGPNYETRAEIEFFRRIGAACVGMSSAVEAKLAAVLGLQQLIASVVTNVYRKSVAEAVTHGSVVEQSKQSAPNLKILIERIVSRLPSA